MESHAGENAPELAHVVFKNWHLVFILSGLIFSIAGAYATLKINIDNLTTKQIADESQANVLNTTLEHVSNQVSASNAKLDILLKNSGLE